MKIGYIRVSSSDQNTERQLQDIELDKVYTDKASGKNTDRPELQKLLAFIREGDILIVHSMDRLARNLKDLLCMVEELTGRGVSVQFIKENLTFDANSDSPMSKLMLSMIGAFAEFERNMIKQRQAEGIAVAKAKGVYTGRKREVTEEQVNQIASMREMGIPMTKIADKLKLSRTTIYRYFPKNGTEK